MKIEMKNIIFFLLLFLVSCKENKREYLLDILQDWRSKEFKFPSELHFIVNGKDSVDYLIASQNPYKIVVYVDSVGCTSCKLRLSAWKKFMLQVDSLSSDSVQFLFFFFPKSKTEISNILVANRFKYPVCIDEQDSLNLLNNIPTEIMFQTFLLDKDNRVVAMGNPVHNPKIRELYLNIILGKSFSTETDDKLLTTTSLSALQWNMGSFDWRKEQLAEFSFTNLGNNAFVIEDVSTSCGCTTVEYSKEPVLPNKKIVLKVRYEAEQPGHFSKMITVYCNTKKSPIQLKISGNAK